MSIWEAIIYAICGGICELLPMSFSGHAAVLQNAFQLSPLSEGGGYFVRAAIILGVIFAILLAFPSEIGSARHGFRLMRRRRRPRRGENRDRLLIRTARLNLIALVPMALSFLFLAYAERIQRLPYIAIFFAIGGCFLFLCCRGRDGQRMERDLTLFDTLSIGLVRMLSVFPGLSSVGSSLAVGQAFEIEPQCNARLTYTITLGYEVGALIYFMLRAILYGSFSGMILLSCIVSVVVTAVVGYFALQYVRYLLQRNRLKFFAFYCWDVAVIVLALALINS